MAASAGAPTIGLSGGQQVKWSRLGAGSVSAVGGGLSRAEQGLSRWRVASGGSFQHQPLQPLARGNCKIFWIAKWMCVRLGATQVEVDTDLMRWVARTTFRPLRHGARLSLLRPQLSPGTCQTGQRAAACEEGCQGQRMPPPNPGSERRSPGLLSTFAPVCQALHPTGSPGAV